MHKREPSRRVGGIVFSFDTWFIGRKCIWSPLRRRYLPQEEEIMPACGRRIPLRKLRNLFLIFGEMEGLNRFEVFEFLVTRCYNIYRGKLSTWLILPAIICLSKRLSHACLSISDYTAKLRTAHYISNNLLNYKLLLG